MKAGARPSVAYVLDPGFPGGTSSAVAAELEVAVKYSKVQVYALDTRMFPGRRVAPQLKAALKRLKIQIIWDCQTISADVVIFHNPSCLKFQDQMGLRLFARHLIVVTHENFQRPGGALAFDVTKCLSQIEQGSIALHRSLAPVSKWNRQTVENWLAENPFPSSWSVLPVEWFNIFDDDFKVPTSHPKDRRGRHSRPGSEKFPNRDVLNACFPKEAENNVILGADVLMRTLDRPSYWTLFPFGSISIEQYFDEIDFLVYFTAPTWRESFGRVIAEAIAAGIIAITDPDTASTFEGGAIGASPEDVNQIIAQYVQKPDRYAEDVITAQNALSRFSPKAFGDQFNQIIQQAAGTNT